LEYETSVAVVTETVGVGDGDGFAVESEFRPEAVEREDLGEGGGIQVMK